MSNPVYLASLPTARVGKDEGGVPNRRKLAVERPIPVEKCGEYSGVRSVACRDEMEIASVWARDVVVSMEELLCFLTSRGLNKPETLEADEITLEVSDSRELPGRRRLVARRKKLVTPDVTELLELMEGERWRSI
jgi:hypothetical protein